jgi:hypothetical protein
MKWCSFIIMCTESLNHSSSWRQTNIDCMIATTINYINLLEGLLTTKAVRCTLKCKHQEHTWFCTITVRCADRLGRWEMHVGGDVCFSPPVVCVFFCLCRKLLMIVSLLWKWGQVKNGFKLTFHCSENSVNLSLCSIWGSHSSAYEEFYLLGYNAMYSSESQPTFQRNQWNFNWFSYFYLKAKNGINKGWRLHFGDSWKHRCMLIKFKFFITLGKELQTAVLLLNPICWAKSTQTR